jgi:mannose-6-phosphate isomerase-like protein (cupin superfamily)
MSTRATRLVSSLAWCGAGVAAALWLMPRTDAADPGPPGLRSRVVSRDEAQLLQADWGRMRIYFRGQTHGSKDVLTAVAVVQPGKAVHRAHRHAEEEYLILTEGSGTWSLGSKQFPAKRGDILYTEPWVYHGVTNTGDSPLVFAVVRFNSKGVQTPPKPDDRPNEL